MSRPRSNNPPCPDCGSVTRKSGFREGTKIRRYICVGEGSNPRCKRRFTDLTKEERLDAKPVEVETRESLRDDTHVFLVTWAQNATEVHPGFWKALNACKDHRNADLVVIKGLYRNPTVRGEQPDDNWWAPEVMDAGLWDQRADLCPILTVLADVRVQPTAARPLTRMDSITGHSSGIVGHPKLEMRVIPTPNTNYPKQMQTTGACTVQNYSESKAGKMGEFHHTIGALIVEVRGDVFHMRQLNACRNGSFIDRKWEYTGAGKVKEAPRAAALSMGDWHSGFTDPNVIGATFDGPESIVGELKPEVIIWDDVLDQYSRNHHHIGNPFIAKAKYMNGDRDSLITEVMGAICDLRMFTEQANDMNGKTRSVVKSSNHDEALTRYIMERNWKNDPENMEFYLDTALKMVQATEMQPNGASYPQAFHVHAKEICADMPIEFLGRKDSFMVHDIECSLHGDKGPNGARGSIMNISKIGVKTIIGHSHVPGIVEGCYQSGTSTYLDLEYTAGPSSWMNSHVVIYGNGKRAIITILKGEWKHD